MNGQPGVHFNKARRSLASDGHPSYRLSLILRIFKASLALLPGGVRTFMYDMWTKTSPLIYGKIAPSVFRVPFGLVLKRCQGPTVEAEALSFMNTLEGIHTPLLVDSVSEGDKNYLLSTWIEGQWLPIAWDDMTSSDKERLVNDLKHQFDTLRSKTISTTHPICSAAGGPIIDPRLPWLRENPRVFDRCQDFSERVWVGLNLNWNRNTLKPLLRPIIERDDFPIVFSHGDFTPRNIIIPGTLASWRLGHDAVHIIDWEMAGWMPTYWDPLKATFTEWESDTEWTAVVRQIFPESNAELDADWEWRSHSRITIV
ncbi:hypothetical protein PHLCEN_2v12483 [Hermanssonia centrifuga]|uniref:Aminoglycoside phosphotransferase domain-containing protein n=1 Tax=Hermanssonia centrifuga TaxID=98765 RepID=A0A2R6NGW7_9APHY|nr:hypothetical protein PHLCEN_2v12483 [Hermanssonia centrifuga]